MPVYTPSALASMTAARSVQGFPVNVLAHVPLPGVPCGASAVLETTKVLTGIAVWAAKLPWTRKGLLGCCAAKGPLGTLSPLGWAGLCDGAGRAAPAVRAGLAAATGAPVQPVPTSATVAIRGM